MFFFFFQAEDGIRDGHVTGVQTCALPISWRCRRSTPPCRTPHPTWNGSPSWGSPGGSATRWSAPPRRSAAREDELEGVDRGAVQVGAVLDRPPGVVEGGALHRQDAGALPVLER